MNAVVAGLTTALGRLGYRDELVQRDVAVPAGSRHLRLVAFCQPVPRDLRTSAVAADVSDGPAATASILDRARGIAAPFALVAAGAVISLFRVGADPERDERLVDVDATDPVFATEMVRSLSPAVLRAAKRDAVQLTLFPIDVRLLDRARHRSVLTLTDRVQRTYAHVRDESGLGAGAAARLVIGALAAVTVRDKYGIRLHEPAAVIDAVLTRHGSYFETLATFESVESAAVAIALNGLAEGIDYSAIDARTINEVYENLLVSPEVRRELGVFYTPPLFAQRLLRTLPVEAIAPGERRVLDPACGSGNLLLAAIERLEALTPGGWTPDQTHAWLNTHVSGSDIDLVATEIARLALLMSSLPLGNNWNIDRRDIFAESPASTPNIIVSNPPWRNATGSRDEAAARFLARSLDLLDDGGLIACVVPATWLSSDTAADSRSRVKQLCDVFEVWRLPRDLFAEARFPTAVVFAQKHPVPKRSRFAFRWLAAGAERRVEFLRSGTVTYSALVPTSPSGAPLLAGPLDAVGGRTLSELVRVVSGVVQKGTIDPQPGARYLALPRGSDYQPYRQIDLAATIPIESGRAMGVGDRDLNAFGLPQLLVQAHRNPDTVWRLRPVIDLVGVVPSNSWHAVVPIDETHDTAFALLALLASSPASAFVHSRVATMNIPRHALERIPLPAGWEDTRGSLAQLGRDLVSDTDQAPVLDAIERVVADAYVLSRRTRRQVRDLMLNAAAPEGGRRFEETKVEHPTPSTIDAEPRTGAVLATRGDRLRIWTIDGPDEGSWHHLPTRLPGWLAAEGKVFDVIGHDVASADFAFHRAAYRSDEELFGPVR